MSDVGTGTTIVFGTSAWAGEVTGISATGVTREDYDTTTLATTGARTKSPKKLVDAGGLDITHKFDPDSQPPISGVTETITITFPTPPGGSTGATLIGSGFVTSSTWSAELEEEMSAETSIMWAALPVWTAST